MIFVITLLILIIYVIGISIYSKIKIEKTQKLLLTNRRNMEHVICSCNENIEKYNALIKNFNDIYEEMGIEGKKSKYLELCQSCDEKSDWVDVKNVVGLWVFVPNTFYRISQFDLYQQNYARWCKKYEGDISKRNKVIIQRIKELQKEWMPLSVILEKKSEKYPQRIKECIGDIVSNLLLNRESDFKADRMIFEFKCARGEDYGIK